MDRELFAKSMGFALVLLGLFFITFARKLCYVMCETCTKSEISTSVLLLLFVGIVFKSMVSLTSNFRRSSLAAA